MDDSPPPGLAGQVGQAKATTPMARLTSSQGMVWAPSRNKAKRGEDEDDGGSLEASWRIGGGDIRGRGIEKALIFKPAIPRSDRLAWRFLTEHGAGLRRRSAAGARVALLDWTESADAYRPRGRAKRAVGSAPGVVATRSRSAS